MRLLSGISIIFAVALSGHSALAEDSAASAYSVDDVISNLIVQADMGQARALCIGTKSECASSAPKIPGFDMLLEFDYNSADLKPEAEANLEVVANALRDDRLKNAKFNVSGHTDAYGTDEYNIVLSSERADAVTKFLVARNIDASRIEAVGMGESHPRSSDPYDPKNRYVELQLVVQ